MGLLDQIAGALGGSSEGGGQNPLIQLVLQYIQSQPGGLQGLIEQFTKAGFGQQVASWVGTGQNLPISGEQLSQVLGGGELGQLLQQFGLNSADGMRGLAQALPDVVNQLTPDGRVEAEAAGSLEQQLSGLLGKLGR